MKIYPPGTHIGPYDVINVLPGGKGGMGAVYIARPRPRYDGPPRVALKMAYGTHNDFLKTEISILQKLQRFNDPHILRVLPIAGVAGTGTQSRSGYIAKTEPDSTQSPYYIVVEYLRGGSVAQLLEQRGRLSCAEAVEIACQVADALALIHDQRIVHLDIKPSNILLREPPTRLVGCTPQIVVSDFGISWEREPGRAPPDQVYGSTLYTAPERSMGAIPHFQNDIFALGVMLYEMVTGETPFTDVVVPGTPLSPQRRPSVLNRQISPALEQVILTAIVTDPAQRYPTVQQMRHDLSHLPGIKRPGRVTLPLVKGTREYTLLGLATMALLLFVVLVSTAFGMISPPAPGTVQAEDATKTAEVTPTSARSTATQKAGQAPTSTIASPQTAPPAFVTSTIAPTATPEPTDTPEPTVPPQVPVREEAPPSQSGPVYNEPPIKEPVYQEPPPPPPPTPPPPPNNGSTQLE